MKSSRKTQSVYRNQNALVRAVFERAGDARKVLCVALDYAMCDDNYNAPLTTIKITH